MVRRRAHNSDTATTNSSTAVAGQISGANFDDYDVMTSSTMSILSEAESDLDTSGGSGRSISAGLVNAPLSNTACQSNSFRSSPLPSQNHHTGKNNRKEEAWYGHILTIDDLVEVDPEKGKIISSLQELATKKHTVLAAHELSTEVS